MILLYAAIYQLTNARVTIRVLFAQNGSKIARIKTQRQNIYGCVWQGEGRGKSQLIFALQKMREQNANLINGTKATPPTEMPAYRSGS